MAMTKKSSTLCIYNILKKYSDENHYLTRDDILTYLKRDYQMDCDRKIVASALEVLEEFNIEFVKDPRKGLYLKTRDFESSQIRYLVDAINSSKYLSPDDAERLINKITSGLSIYQKDDYPTISKSSLKITNDFFDSIDKIDKAIKLNQQIKFKYVEYNEQGKLVPRFGGHEYVVSPYYLINNFGKYYLYCNYEAKNNIAIFKIGSMKDVKIIDTKINVNSEMKKFKIDNYLNEHIYMYNGKVITAKLLIENPQAISDVKEWFPNAKISIEEKEIYATVTCDENALFYWCLQYIESIKVIRPYDLREKIMTKINHAYDVYKKIPRDIDDLPHFYLDRLIDNWIDMDFKSIKDSFDVDRLFLIKSLYDYLNGNILDKKINYSSNSSKNITLNVMNNDYCIDVHYYEDELDEDTLNKLSQEFSKNFIDERYIESYMVFICRNVSVDDIKKINNRNVKWNFYRTKLDQVWLSYTVVKLSKYGDE